uniref:Uncharacterized protein n=1 Tax=Lactuca sativa TaxID=4236 RepID=A0A9R1X2M7_LACSA|nr:hypothetical protein LSAT_V11C700374540 [Lactuca sativa]
MKSWKWNEVVGLVSYDNQQQVTDEDVDTEDTADSVKPLKTPRVTIQRRNRFSKFSHLPNDKDYRYGLELPVDVNHPIHGEDDVSHPTEDDVGVDVDKTMTNMTSGVYTFCVNRGIYHRIDQLIPRDGKPRYLKLYIYHADYEMSHRLKWKNIDKQISQNLIRVLATNPYMQIFRRLADLGPLDNYKVTLNASVELDQRVYNRPTTSDVP